MSEVPDETPWTCEDEDGRSYHPELDEIAELTGNIRVIFEAEDRRGPAPIYDWVAPDAR